MARDLALEKEWRDRIEECRRSGLSVKIWCMQNGLRHTTEKSNQIEDRIVSISQPHVRPIVRGKAKAATDCDQYG